MAKRPALPMVIGVLMIVFSTIALVVTALAVYVATRDDVVKLAPDAAKLSIVVLLLPDVIVGFVELSAGIGLVRYRAAGPDRALHFAIMRTLATVVGAAYILLEESGGGAGGTIARMAIGLVWPAIVLALLSRLRRSCDAPVARAAVAPREP